MTAHLRARVRPLVLGAILAASTVLSSACSDDAETVVSERALTFEEASLMAEVLYRNYEGGGARFVVNTLTAPGGDQLTLQGEIDWLTHTGWADVLTTDQEATITGVWWSDTAVLERRPSIDAVLVGMGYPAAPLIGRPVDLDRRIDQVMAIVTGLAAEQRDNAQLIMQTEGSAFVRDDTLRGRPVLVLRYGTRNLYWIDAETGDMLRLEATSKEGGLPTLVDLERAEIEVPTPEASTVIDAAAIAELYEPLGDL